MCCGNLKSPSESFFRLRLVARCAARWSARASLYSALATPLRNQVVGYASDAYTAQGSVVVVRVVRGSSSREVRRATGQGGIASLWQPQAARAWMRLLRPRVYSAVGPGTECAAVERERHRVLKEEDYNHCHQLPQDIERPGVGVRRCSELKIQVIHHQYLRRFITTPIAAG